MKRPDDADDTDQLTGFEEDPEPEPVPEGEEPYPGDVSDDEGTV